MIYNRGAVASNHTENMTTYTTRSVHQIRGIATACVLALTVSLSASAAAMAPADIDALIARCASSVHPSTLTAVVRVESRFNPLAIGVNGLPALRVRPQSVDAAVRTAERLIGQGRSIDLGLGQINSANLEWLGLSIRDAFDPCQNLAASARVLADTYVRYREDASNDQDALDAALSAYNTGNRTGGIRNGYVAKVRQGAGAAPRVPTAVTVAVPMPPAWDVFARAATQGASAPTGSASVMVFGSGQ